MRMFTLASSEASEYVDLRDYKSIIESTVTGIIPKAKVEVFKNCYVIDEVTKGESIRIGRILASTQLGKYCIKISKLFSGETIDETDLKNLEDLSE